MESLVTNCPEIHFAAVISNNPQAPGLEWAVKHGVQAISVGREAGSSVVEHKARLWQQVDEHNPEFVFLAGFMQIVPAEIVARYPRRIINIHPSLLPDLPGLDTHQRALALGRTRHGATVHVVDAGIDTGAVIAQAPLEVQPGESAEQLGARVLTREHELYPWVASALATKDLVITNYGITVSDRARAQAAAKDFLVGG